MVRWMRVAVVAWIVMGGILLQSAEPKDISGRYRFKNYPDEVLIIEHVADNIYRVTPANKSWEGGGTFDGTTYVGMWKYPDKLKKDPLGWAGAWGIHKATLKKRGKMTLVVEARNIPLKKDFRVTWIREK